MTLTQNRGKIKTDSDVSFLLLRRQSLEKKKQSVGEIRKKEILEAAKRVFLRKGYVEAVMEDIIAETTLSRGGVYYHYKSKVEIMHDLMREGIDYRMEKIKEFLRGYSGEIDKSAVAQMIVDKMLDESDLMSIYAIYLQAQRTNKELRDLFPVLVEETLEAANIGEESGKRSNYGYLSNDFFIFLINTFILGCEILGGARESYVKNRDSLVKMVKGLLDLYDEGLIK